MKRIASVIGLKREHRAEYEDLHAKAWPSVLARISQSGIRNYSIYRHGDLLFSYLEYVGDDFDTDMAAMADDAETQRWWAICTPMQVPVDDRAVDGGWKEIPEVFHHD